MKTHALRYFQVLAVLLVMSAATALAADGDYHPYVAVKGGGSFTSISSINNTSPVANPAQPTKGSADETTGLLGLSAGIGLKPLGLPMRVEVEYAWRSDFDYNPNPTFQNAAIPSSLKSHLNSQTVFLNLFYEFENTTAFTPYIGAGAGMAWNRTKATGTVIATGTTQDYRKTTDSFAWNVGAGCTYSITDNWKAEAGYRFVDLGKVVWGDGQTSLTSKNITGHELLLGLRYQF